jgi:hypothetical protein
MDDAMQHLIESRNMLRDLPVTRAVALAITKTEEAMMWLNAAYGREEVIGIFDTSPFQEMEEPEVPSGGPN